MGKQNFFAKNLNFAFLAAIPRSMMALLSKDNLLDCYTECLHIGAEMQDPNLIRAGADGLKATLQSDNISDVRTKKKVKKKSKTVKKRVKQKKISF